jgi:hypothetical protein
MLGPKFLKKLNARAKIPKIPRQHGHGSLILLNITLRRLKQCGVLSISQLSMLIEYGVLNQINAVVIDNTIIKHLNAIVYQYEQ